MESSRDRATPLRVAGAALATVIPFGLAIAGGLWVAALLAPAFAAAALRYIGSWRAWLWVAATIAMAATAWGWFAWSQANAHCLEATPLIPAISTGVSVLVGAAAGAAVVRPTGSVRRMVGGGAIAAVTTAALVIAASFLLVGLGMPALLVAFSHC